MTFINYRQVNFPIPEIKQKEIYKFSLPREENKEKWL